MIKRISILAFVALSACVPNETVTSQTGTDGTWILQTIEGRAISTPISIEFPAAGRVIGAAPCNNYTATLTSPLPWFSVDTIGRTKKACGLNGLENQYFDALGAATLSEVKGDILVLNTPNRELLVYKRAPLN